MKLAIRILLCGGLGNQLFQYAFARALAERFDAGVQLDLGTGFARDLVYRRNYELNVFQLPDRVELIQPTKFEMQIERIKLALARRNWFFEKYYLLEPNRGDYLAKVETLKPLSKCTSFGYWQNERYFSEVEDILRKELSFSRELSLQNQALAKDMQSTDSVALHVRRVQYDCAVDASYYDRAIAEMIKRVPGSRFYCFSDDMDWCREQLLPKYPIELIDNRGLPAVEDFQLMTHCRNFITANSSFSWWAAWLGGRAGQVLTPALDMRHRIPQVGDRPGHWQSVS
ncbi:alpha-1,2-fucosyltransferase [Coraliomargarita sp. W4R53]